jgi:hypothetical protein
MVIIGRRGPRKCQVTPGSESMPGAGGPGQPQPGGGRTTKGMTTGPARFHTPQRY